MKTRKQIESIVDKAINACFKDDKLLGKKALGFVKLFNAQPRMEAIELLSNFLKRIRMVVNSTTMIVESTIPLSKKQKDIIKRKLSLHFTITNSEFKLNPQLLGGLRIKVGDHIYDASIRSRIYQVKEAIAGS